MLKHLRDRILEMPDYLYWQLNAEIFAVTALICAIAYAITGRAYMTGWFFAAASATTQVLAITKAPKDTYV